MSVIELASPPRVDEAWEQYQSLAVQLRDNPHLLADRSFNERMAKAHERWRRLFLMQEGGSWG